MARFDVVGFGALNVDKLFKVDRIAHAEEESFVQSVHETCGGSAANTIVGLARLGYNVGFIGKVGNDHEGHLLLDEFVGEHVDPQGITRVEGSSGSVMGFVDKQGARALYINSGVNDTIKPNEINPAYLSDTKYLHLTSFVGKTSFETQKNLLENLPNGIRVSFDPGALYAQKTYKTLAPIIEKTYVMMPNALELQAITKQKTPEKGAQFFLDKGVKIVAVKMGADGCYVTDGKESHQIAALKVPVVDTTGAGDAFCAGFLFGLLNNRCLSDCGKIGNFIASRCVMQMGARTGLPYLEDLGALR
jgi:ribokinase